MKYLSGLLVLCVGLLFLCVTSAMAQPKGIYCFSSAAGHCTTSTILNDADITGIFRPVNWSDVETSPGVYDYSSLLNDWNKAIAAHKKVEFSVGAGIHTPNWDANTWVSLPHGNVPVPWDSAYQINFANLMNALPAEIWDNTANVDAVYATGLNYWTGEQHLLGGACVEMGTGINDCPTWLNAGYTPTLLENSFSTLFGSITFNFAAGTTFVSAIVPGGYPLTDTKADNTMNGKLFTLAANSGYPMLSQNDGWTANFILANQVIYQEAVPLGTGLCNALTPVLAQTSTRALQIYPGDFTSGNASCIHNAAVTLSQRQ